MPKLLISVAAIGLLAATSAAFAQPDDHHGGGGGAPAMHGGPAGGGHAPAAHAAPPMHAAPSMHAAPGAHDTHTNNNEHFQHGGGAASAPHFDNHVDNHANRAPAMNGQHFDRDHGNAMRGTGAASAGGHRDFSSYHRNFNATRRYHAPAYRRPSGWYARRWTYGQILPALFWTHDYWLDDYNGYGLMAPPPGTVWVRDGDDALLIDQDSGEIIQVEYDVFD